MKLHGGSVGWYVYKGDESNCFWLSTERFVDCFLCCLDDPATPGTDVVNVTNRHGAGAGTYTDRDRFNPWGHASREHSGGGTL